MIYIENNLEKQDLFIPRNDGSGCYVSPYDKGYQDGYQDGIEDCGDCPIQQKEVILTATTETISPDQGYAGMDSVFVDARQLALEKYNEGYHEGEEDGAEEQKDKLASTAFTQNGVYRREDGWNEVEVSVGDIPCVLEEKSAIVTANTQTVLPSSGYEGMSAVEIDATDFGYAQYISGWGDGINNQKSKLSGDTFTENGDYLRADGWSAVTVDVRPQLETKNIVLTAATECITKTPDTTYIGFAVPKWARENGINTGIKTDSATTIRVKYIGRGQQSDRVAGTIQYYDGASWDWRFFDAPGMGKTRYYRCGSKSVGDSTTGQSFTEAGVLYDYTMEKDALYDNINGVVVFELTGATIPTNYNIWVDVGSIWLEELTIEKGEGVVFHGTAYDDGEGTIGLYDSVSDSVFTLYSGSSGTLVTYTVVYDGIGEVCVDATNICQTYYSEGYQDGQAECPPCPEIESAVTYGIGSGFTGATITPSSGYDGMAEVTITDNGYGQEKYDEGFADGQTDILSGLTDTTIRQNGSYSNPSGWSGVTVSVQPTLEAASYALPTGFTGTTIVPSSGYDGLSSVVITDNGYGQEKYDEGYNDGQASCPQPTLEQQSVTLTATTECFTPSSGYDGIEEICVDATDIYNQGYNDGHSDAGGFDDGYNEGLEDGIWSNEYLTFEAIQNGGIELYSASSPAAWHIDNPEFLQIDYSINGGPWTTITSLDKLSHTGSTLPSFTPQIAVSAGDIVRVRGLNNSYVLNYPNAVSIINHFRITPCYVYGNIMSLVYGDNFVGKTAFPSGTSRNFYFLFFLYMDTVNRIYNMNGVYSHPTKRLVLPATSLTDGCYTHLFSGTYIERAPNLPATVLTSGCYSNIFAGCTGLTNAPKLPAKMLAQGCYNGMFEDCTSLTTAPALPATTLTDTCYNNMFANCTSLTTAPELSARTLVDGCYRSMFAGCSNLNYVKCLATNPYLRAIGYWGVNWLDNVSPTGTFVKDANTDWSVVTNSIPSGWTVLNA